MADQIFHKSFTCASSVYSRAVPCISDVVTSNLKIEVDFDI